MLDANSIPSNLNELPSQYADRLGVAYGSTVREHHKKKLGQYFTPLAVAGLLADFARGNGPSLRILDPGCGTGILSAVLCEKLALAPTPVAEIHLVAFETDIALLPFAENCLNYLALWLRQRGIEFTYFLCKNDFILHNSHVFENHFNTNGEYDIIISNPPYFKLPKGDVRIEAAKTVIYGQTNIYSIFMVIAAKLLKSRGQLVFITPRSFCSGSYFRLFREVFFSMIDLEGIHIFQSRTDAFKRDQILQENVVVVARRKTPQMTGQMLLPFEQDREQRVFVSSSTGLEDLHQRRVKAYPSKILLNMDSLQKILFLPASDIDDAILEQFRKWKGSFSKYEMKVSTGPVVDFRNLNYIRHAKDTGTVPLIWLHHIHPMKINWPCTSDKGKNKGAYICAVRDSMSRLVVNKNYVLMRRFSTKDDKNRLIAAPFLAKKFDGVEHIGIENHLNYIYALNRELNEEEIFGIALLLNSQLFDLYFRTFNGNINVSATELRDFPLPELETIRLLGRKGLNQKKKNNNLDIDKLVLTVFNSKLALPKRDER